jgi:hypothetical protein
MPVKYTQTFRAPTEYERQLEEARRRAALAEALAQQQYEPMEGNAAPIPKAAPLVKALQSFMTARAGRQAQEAAEEAKGMEADYAQRMLGRMQGGYVYDPNAPAPAPIPEQTELGEVTRQSQYRRAPEEVLGMASTSLGTAALKDRPVMAQRLAQMLETPKEAEYGTTPQYDEQGRAYVVSKAGNVRYLDGVSKAPETTELQRNYEYAKGQGYTGSFDDFRKSGIARTTVDVRYGAPVSGVDAEGNPVFFQPNPTGGPPSIIQGVRPEGKAQTESQANAALYAERMAESEPVFESFAPPSYGSRAKESLPGNIGNVMLTPEARQWFQAERNFINAVLRKESGAVISDSEFDSARKQYIPQPGDDEKTKAQKRQARETAIRAIGAAAGANYKPAPINPPEGVTPQEWAVMTLDERRKFAR